MTDRTPGIDLFCRVVDNFGDIGVCWRLARQLAALGPVRLLVDDYAVFKKILPELDETRDLQTTGGVTLLRWDETVLLQHFGDPAPCVIEAFACELPAFVIEKMRAMAVKPVWIDLEYLSAEDWVEGCHARPSPHPATGLLTTLFFPGFTAATGGLIREAGLLKARRAFQADPALRADWRRLNGVPPRQDGLRDLSLFCYPQAPAQALLDELAGQNIRVFVPEGVLPDLASPLLCRIPFLPQDDYDRLLWDCDLNFVRGEDSWIRALWAGKPFIWQAYPQADGASDLKLSAFLQRYVDGAEAQDAELLADFHAMWNLGGREAKSAPRQWSDLLQAFPGLDTHAKAWTDRQALQDDCATQLTRFIRAQYAQQLSNATG